MAEYRLGRLAGLEIGVMPTALVGTLGLWATFTGIALWLMQLPASEAILFGLAAAALQWLFELIHQLGHAWAARRTGYPMIGVRFGVWYIFAISLYPPDEPELPASIHVRRALGGPLWGVAMTFLAGVILVALRDARGTLVWWLALFAFLENLFIFTLQVLVPLGFNDGQTLWNWWHKR